MLSRRAAIGVGTAALLLPGAAAAGRLQRGWIGTYTPDGGPADLGTHLASRGLYGFDFDAATGMLGEPWLASERRSPTNLIVHPDGRTVYACRGGNGDGEIAALRVDGRALRPLNSLPSGGTGPTHGAIDRRGRFLVTTNFSSDEVVAFRLAPDGSLVERTARIAAAAGVQGAAAPPPPGVALPPQPDVCRTSDRRAADGCRTKPHIACFSPGQRFVLVAEIATDAVATYRFDAARGALELHAVARGQEGGGPRHLAWAPSGRFFYSSDEHGSQVSAWAWDEAKGRATRIQSLSTLPSGFTGRNTTAHIAMHPGGRTLWVSNRGHPSIAGFQVDPRTGLLAPGERTATGSRDCWCFDIDRSGRWLIAALLSTDAVAVFAIDPVRAALRPLPQRRSAPFPTCLRLSG